MIRELRRATSDGGLYRPNTTSTKALHPSWNDVSCQMSSTHSGVSSWGARETVEMAHTQRRPGASAECFAVTLRAVRFCLKDSHVGQVRWAVGFPNATRDWTRLRNYCDRPKTADEAGANAVGAVTCRTPKLLGRFLGKLNLDTGVRDGDDGGMSG